MKTHRPKVKEQDPPELAGMKKRYREYPWELPIDYAIGLLIVAAWYVADAVWHVVDFVGWARRRR